MDVEQIRAYCLKKQMVEECFPFDEVTLVFKVRGKMFLLMSLDASPLSINVKCDPDTAIQLRDEYDCVLPGYHMNKRHWNTILINGCLPAKDLKVQIDNSYDLVAAGTPRAKKQSKP